MEEYFAAKQMLFSGAGAPPPAWAVLNRDDEWCRQRADLAARAKCCGSAWARAPPCARGTSPPTCKDLRFEVQTRKTRFMVESPLLGKINVYNILAACCAGLSYGFPAGDHRGRHRAVPRRPGTLRAR